MDWLAVALGLTAWFVMPHRRLLAMALLLVGNVVWLSYALPRGLWGVVGLNTAYMILNARTILIWRRESAQGAA